VADSERVTSEDEALSAGRDRGRRYVDAPDLGDRLQVCNFAISTASDAGVHHSATIVAHKVVGHHLRHRVPIAGAEVGQVALLRSACRVFESPLLWAQLLEAGKGGVDVIL